MRSVSGEWLSQLEDLWPQLRYRSSRWGHSVLDSMRSGYVRVGELFEGEEDSDVFYSEYSADFSEGFSEAFSGTASEWDDDVHFQSSCDEGLGYVDSLPPSDVYDDSMADYSGHGIEDSIFFDAHSNVGVVDSGHEMTHTIVQNAELVEVQAENTVHSDPDIADFHQRDLHPSPISENSLQEALDKPLTLSTTGPLNQKGTQRKSTKKNPRRTSRGQHKKPRILDPALSLYAELSNVPDFDQDSKNQSENEDHSDPELLSSWFITDENNKRVAQSEMVSVQQRKAPMVVQGGQISEEHSDTYEQLIEAQAAAAIEAQQAISEGNALRPHIDLADRSSPYYSFENEIVDEREIDEQVDIQPQRPIRIRLNAQSSASNLEQPSTPVALSSSVPNCEPSFEESHSVIPDLPDAQQHRLAKPASRKGVAKSDANPSSHIDGAKKTDHIRYESSTINVDSQTSDLEQTSTASNAGTAQTTKINDTQLQTTKQANLVDVLPGRLVGGEIEVTENRNPYEDFQVPSLKLLDIHERDEVGFDTENLQELALALTEKLEDFGVKGEVSAIRPGPVITTFEFAPARGVKISKISSLSDDIAMALRAIRVRIVAPIPGKGVVGIEIPNDSRQIIWASEMFGSKAYQEAQGLLPLVLGKTVDGYPYVSDLAKMPHLLVGGTTGSGKSVGINTMLMSMLFKNSPEDLRLILIDPKMLEFEMYRDIPHLIYPVVTDPNEASGILKWACDEMDRRYAMMAKFGTRNLKAFNRRVIEELKSWDHRKARKYRPDYWDSTETYVPRKLPYLVVVIDELADLMMVADKDVEESIIRLAQKARACGIHLIVATQRPSVNVITGMIKANMPCRIAFQVRQKVDGRTILDQNGAENLLGKGDMLFLPPGTASLVRCHGPFISDEEVQRVTDYLREQAQPIYEAEVPQEEMVVEDAPKSTDSYFDAAVQFVIESNRASTSMIQRRFSIGYNRAANIMESMESAGIVGPPNGARPREILMSLQQYLNLDYNG